MPELPEVETIRRQLEPLIVGKTISGIEVFNPKSFGGDRKRLIESTISGIERKGKVIIVSLKRPGLAKQGRALYVHLKMSGQLRYRYFKISISFPSDNRHLRVLFKFSNGDCLEFHDQRKFGWIRIVNHKSKIINHISGLPLGVDALDPGLTAGKLAGILKSSNRPIKMILLDQSKIAGIGNIYASEILWEARISPFRKGPALLLQQGRALIKSIRKILDEAIKSGGSTMDDGLYQHVGGESGNYWSRRRVYDREGKPCLRCKTPVKKGFLGQRSTYWCPECQMVR